MFPVFKEFEARVTLKIGKRIKCLGYVNHVKGYRLLDPTTHKAIVSKDVMMLQLEGFKE